MEVCYVSEGVGLYLCIAEVVLEGSYKTVFYMFVCMFMFHMNDIVMLSTCYDNMHGMSSIESI